MRCRICGHNPHWPVKLFPVSSTWQVAEYWQVQISGFLNNEKMKPHSHYNAIAALV